MTQRNAWKLAATLTVLLGCGDDGEGGGKSVGPKAPSAAEACGDICEGMRAARCNVDLAACESLCAQQYASTPASCRTLADQLLDCASKATFSCSSDGPEATFCRELEAKLDVCSGAPVEADAGLPPVVDAGNQASGDDASTVPMSSDGAVERDASALDASADASLVRDASPGTGDGSANDGGTLGALSCQPTPEDNACDRCIKSSCCRAVEACGRDCQLLGACVADCQTDTCLQTCAAQNVAGIPQFESVLSCTTDSCEDACGETGPGPNSPRPPPANCLPTFAPEGTCSGQSRPVGYDCKGAPFPDCVAVPNISDVYCCARR